MLVGIEKETISHLALEGSARVGQRTHVAAVWDGKTTRLFVDGKPMGMIFRNPGTSRGAGGTSMGVNPAGGKPKAQDNFAGIIDEIRLSKTARYTKAFDPEDRFTPDGDTLALYHCDEGKGDTLLDSSDNKHHGRIMYAKWVKAGSTPSKPLAPLSSRSTVPELAPPPRAKP